jgi:hypothetical protein
LWWKRRQARLALAAIDKRTPDQVALDELARIAGMRLPEAGRFKEHYTLVADTVRLYMERTYQVPILERTTAEIRTGLAHTAIAPETHRLFIGFLNDSDLVKFSKSRPTIEEAYDLVELGKEIVARVSHPVEGSASQPSIDVDQRSDPEGQSPGTPSERKTIPQPAGKQLSANGRLPNMEVRA